MGALGRVWVSAVTVLAAVILFAPNSASAAATRAGSAKAKLAGRIFTVAGALRWTGPRDNAPLATGASFSRQVLSAMPDGGFLIADQFADLVLRVWPGGSVAIVAGGGHRGLGDGGPATKAEIMPSDVAALPRGGFLITDSGDYRVREVWPDGHISTVAGNGQEGYSGDGGPATKAALDSPNGIAVMPHCGGFLIADQFSDRVRRVWPDGHISTVAGTGRPGFSGDGGPARRATLRGPADVAALPRGGFLIADTYNDRVRRVWPNGRISTVGVGLSDPTSVAVMPGGGFLVGAEQGPVRRVWPDGHSSTLTGNAGGELYGDGGPARAAQLYPPDAGASVAVLPDGSALVGSGNTVRVVVGSRGARLLAAAIRPLLSVATRNAYQARVVLTKPAHLTIRIYSAPRHRLVMTAHAFRSAGESTLTVKLGSHLDPGLYAIDLRAQRAAQTTRAEQYAYLGGSLTAPTVRWVENQILADELANDPNESGSVKGCHQFTPLRVDCAIEVGGYGYVNASTLTTQGQLRSRSYINPADDQPQVFKLDPRWHGPATLHDLGAAWHPGIH